MATVGKMVAVLTAKTGGFTSGLNKAKGETKGFVSSLTGGLGRAGKAALMFGGAIAGAAGVAGVAIMAKQSLASIDKLGKLSDQLGISTENLGAWGHAATLAGADQATLDKGLQKFTANLGYLKTGTGSYRTVADGLKAIGMSGEDIKNMSNDDAFKAIADKIQATEDPAKRAAALMAVFGRSGLQLGNLMMQGSAGLEAARKEFDALGMTVSRTDASKAEQFNDAMARLSAVLKGGVQRAVIALAPHLTKFTTGLIKSAVFLKGTFSALWNAIKGIVSGVVKAMGGFGDLTAGWEAVKSGLMEGIIALEFWWGNWADITKLALLETALNIETFGNDAIFFFTDTIPTALRWFADNWKDIFVTIGYNTLMFFQNLGDNIVAIFKNLPGLIKGKVKFDDVWKPLGEGFINTVKEMPEFAERGMGDLEGRLAAKVKNLKTSLGGEYSDYYDKRMAEFKDGTKNITATVTDTTTTKKAIGEVAVQTTEAAEKTGVAETKSAGAMTFGSREAYSASMKQNKAIEHAKSTADNTKKTNALLAENNRLQQERLDNEAALAL